MARVDTSGHDASSACANCGATLAGPYCARCGQHGHVHRTMGAFLHDVLHGVFHFEGKFWATLPMLATRPGELTRRYAAGERAKFVSPVAVFLFSAFLMFAAVANIPFLAGAESFGRDPGLGSLRAEVAEQRAAADKEVRDAAAELVKAREAGNVRKQERERERLDAARGSVDVLARAQRLLPPPGTPARATAPAAQAASDQVGEWMLGKVEHARRNPALVAYKIRSSAYKFSWALIPLSLPFMWLLFPRRRDVSMYDHAVFATYSISFMSLLLIAATLLRSAGVPGGLVSLATVAVVPWHMFRQLKGAYGLGRAGAAWRTGWLLLFAAITAGLFAAGLTYLGTS